MLEKEMVEVIIAHINGKQIQYNDGKHGWRDCTHNKPIWDFATTTYRVKPEIKMRPYKDREECWNDMLKHGPIGWLKVKNSGDYMCFSSISKFLDFNYYFENYVYVDGLPFGIIEND